MLIMTKCAMFTIILSLLIFYLSIITNLNLTPIIFLPLSSLTLFSLALVHWMSQAWQYSAMTLRQFI